jgi:hypothetical protein
VRGRCTAIRDELTGDLADPNVMFPAGYDPYVATVRNGTARLPSRCHDGCMLHKKSKKELENATRSRVAKEMAKPRMAKSARIAERNLDTARTRNSRLSRKQIILSPRSNQPEKMQIAVEGADHQHQDLRIDNTLTEENGNDVRFKKDAHVSVIVTV